MRRSILWTCLFGTVIVVTGCGGGGGGGGGGGSPYNSPNPYLRTEVPYATPVKVATVDPLVNQPGTGYKVALVDTHTADISGTGSQDVIVAGRMTQPTTQAEWGDNLMHMFSWSNGTLVDRTSQWFPGGINQIIGTEGQVKFADFFNTGRQDMFVAPSTDGDYYGPAYLFRNSGTSFTRQTIDIGGNIGAHGSDVADLNGDGFKDIVMTHYGPNTTLAINDRVSGFRIYQPHDKTGDLRFGGTAIVAADFLQNGSTQFVVTDTGCREVNCNTAATRLYTWNIDSPTDRLSISYYSTLPTPRFELPKWDHKRTEFGLNHAIYAVAYDFNSDRVPDVITSNRPSNTGAYSELQFLQNNGQGVFSDVTDNILVGWDVNTHAPQFLRFLDLNGDGLEDILAAGAGTSSAQILLKSSDGKYIASYKNILTDFAKQAEAMQSGYDSNSTSVNIIKGPNGKLYLLTGVSFIQGEGVTSDRQTSLYLSEIGAQGTITAKAAVDLILQKWPYMSAAQANEVLARTAATYMNGTGMILDLEAALRPIGQLSLPTFRGLQPISGYISGVSLDNGQVIVKDELSRGFATDIKGMNVSRTNMFGLNMEHNDNHELTSHAEYLVAGNKLNYGNLRVGAEDRNNYNGHGSGDPTMIGRQFNNYTVGMPKVWSRGGFSYGAQYTSLNQNPWISMGGAWGSVTNSQIMDNVVTYRNSGFSVQGSLMYVTTQITPGLITNIKPMTGGWAETGYRYTNWEKQHGDIGVYVGVKPVVFSGSVEANLPTAIDNNGNISYTRKNMTVQSPTTTYVRAMYTNQISKQTQYRISGMLLDNGQYRIMNEWRFFLK